MRVPHGVIRMDACALSRVLPGPSGGSARSIRNVLGESFFVLVSWWYRCLFWICLHSDVAFCRIFFLVQTLKDVGVVFVYLVVTDIYLMISDVFNFELSLFWAISWGIWGGKGVWNSYSISLFVYWEGGASWFITRSVTWVIYLFGNNTELCHMSTMLFIVISWPVKCQTLLIKTYIYGVYSSSFL